jgi:hypothetical protein
MASRTNPNRQDHDGSNAPNSRSIRTSETLHEQTEELGKQQPRQPEVDFNQLQARFG